MKPEDRERVEALLQGRAEELRKTRVAIHGDPGDRSGSELADYDQHPADQGSETHDREVELTTELMLTAEEDRVAEARRALAEGKYGICLGCGSEIPKARLEAMPETVRCVDCQRHHEGGIRQGNDQPH